MLGNSDQRITWLVDKLTNITINGVCKSILEPYGLEADGLRSLLLDGELPEGIKSVEL